MCCFSRPVLSVSGTHIFARAGGGGRQFLVYEMTLNGREELAMILPIPVRRGTVERAGRFITTVHIHDGRVYATAQFDHDLFCQRLPSESIRLPYWQESPALAATFLKVEKTAGLVYPDAHCYHHAIRGRQQNQDTWV